MASRPIRLVAHAVGAALFFLAFFFVNRSIGMRQFAGFDFGPMLHLLAQLADGRQAGVDFISPYPPFFGWGLLFAHRVLGPSWQSFVDLGGAFAAACAIACYFVWRKVTSAWLAFFLALAASVQSSLFIGVWWYGPAALWLSLIFIGVVAQLDEKSRWGWLAAVFFAALLLLNKPNTIAPILLFGLLHVGLPRRFSGLGAPRLAAGLAAGSILAAAGACWLGGFRLGPYFELLSRLGGRVANPMAFTTGLPWALDFQVSGAITLALTLAGFFAWGGLRVLARAKTAPFLLIAGLLASFLASFFLNGEYPLTSCPLLAGALLLAGQKRFTPKQTAAICLCWAVAGAYAFVKAERRDRVLSTGDGQFFEAGANIRQPSGLFKGLETGPRFANFSSETQAALRALKPKSVFFGPRVEFGYLRFGYEPPRGLPLWWDPRSAYAPTQQAMMGIASAWFASRFDVLVLDRADMTYLPMFVANDISSNYIYLSPGMKLSEAGIFVRRDWLAKFSAQSQAGAPSRPVSASAAGASCAADSNPATAPAR